MCLNLKGCLLIISVFPVFIFSRTVETFYGDLEVEEPVILELIDSAPMQRLKGVHQYGVSYYTDYHEEYTRFEHSLGVFAILRIKGASIQEQIAGLLHDVSHTAFSHVGDWIFQMAENKDAYQDSIHEWFLAHYGIRDILMKHGFFLEDVLHKSGGFLMLEQDLPNLCADRIDYNLQGAFYRNVISKEEAKSVLDDLTFEGQNWFLTHAEKAALLTRFSLMMTKQCWGSPANYLTSQWLADSLLRSCELGKISIEDIHFGKDDELWDLLNHLEDPFIQERMWKISHVRDCFTLEDGQENALIVHCKFRGVDPWIQKEGMLQRLTAIDQNLAYDFFETKQLMDKGWTIKLNE